MKWSNCQPSSVRGAHLAGPSAATKSRIIMTPLPIFAPVRNRDFNSGIRPHARPQKTRAGKYGNCSLFNRNMQKTVLGAPGEAHIEKVQMEGTWGLWQNPLIKPKSPIHSVMTITDVCGRVCCSTAQGGGKQRASGRRWSRQPWRRRLYDRAGRWGVVCLQDVDQRWTLGTNS